MFPPYLLPHLPPCAPRKDRDALDEKVKSQLLEREQEQIDRLVRESGGKLTRRLANSQVTADPVSERVFKALPVTLPQAPAPHSVTWFPYPLLLGFTASEIRMSRCSHVYETYCGLWESYCVGIGFTPGGFIHDLGRSPPLPDLQFLPFKQRRQDQVALPSLPFLEPSLV